MKTRTAFCSYRDPQLGDYRVRCDFGEGDDAYCWTLTYEEEETPHGAGYFRLACGERF